MGRKKYPNDAITIPEKIQARLTETERQEFYEVWKELEPYSEWAGFCRKMIRKGIEQAREDQRILREYKAAFTKKPE